MALKSIPFLQAFQSSLGSLFARLPLTATQITLSSVLFAAIGLYYSAYQLPYHSLFFFILAGAADAIDGAVARAKNQVSNRGAYIDGITDRIVEFLFVLSFFFYALPPFIIPAGLSLIVFLFFGSAMSAFATAYAEHRHVADSAKIARQPGILPRAERLLLLFAALALVPFFPPSSSFVLLCAAALSVATFFQRAAYYSN